MVVRGRRADAFSPGRRVRHSARNSPAVARDLVGADGPHRLRRPAPPGGRGDEAYGAGAAASEHSIVTRARQQQGRSRQRSGRRRWLPAAATSPRAHRGSPACGRRPPRWNNSPAAVRQTASSARAASASGGHRAKVAASAVHRRRWSQTMDEINASSEERSPTSSGVIDGIAFQTNTSRRSNAAVEACGAC